MTKKRVNFVDEILISNPSTEIDITHETIKSCNAIKNRLELVKKGLSSMCGHTIKSRTIKLLSANYKLIIKKCCVDLTRILSEPKSNKTAHLVFVMGNLKFLLCLVFKIPSNTFENDVCFSQIKIIKTEEVTNHTCLRVRQTHIEFGFFIIYVRNMQAISCPLLVMFSLYCNSVFFNDFMCNNFFLFVSSLWLRRS